MEHLDNREFVMVFVMIIAIMLIGSWYMEGMYKFVFESPAGPLAVLYMIFQWLNRNKPPRPPLHPPNPFGDPNRW